MISAQNWGQNLFPNLFPEAEIGHSVRNRSDLRKQGFSGFAGNRSGTGFRGQKLFGTGGNRWGVFAAQTCSEQVGTGFIPALGGLFPSPSL